MNYYEQSLAIMELDGDKTEPFRTHLGFKQGGPSSPTLFNFIGHDLIIEIENMGCGASIGNIPVDTIVYADDTLLVSDRATNMRKMITVLERYAKTNE